MPHLTLQDIVDTKRIARLLRRSTTTTKPSKTTRGGQPQERVDLPAQRSGDITCSENTPQADQVPSDEPQKGPSDPRAILPSSESAAPIALSTHNQDEGEKGALPPTNASGTSQVAVLGGQVVVGDPEAFLQEKATRGDPSTHVSATADPAEQEKDGRTVDAVQAPSKEHDSSSVEQKARTLEMKASELEEQAMALRERAAALRVKGKSRKKVSGPLQESITQEDVVILVLGGIGTGKSAFVNALVGQEDVAVGHSLESHTDAVIPYEVYSADGSRLVVVDSPGFGDTHKSELEILESIVTWLSKLYDKRICLTGIAFLHRISDNRMAGSSLRNFNLLRALSGDEAARNTVLVTSMWDIVDKELAERREKDIVENFWKPVLDNHAHLARFSPTASSAWEIIKLFDLKSKIVMQIQREIIEKRLRLSETAAGSIISSRWAEIEKDQLKELEAAREELARAREQGNQGMSDMAMEELRRVNELRADLEASRRRLQGQKAIRSKVFGRFNLRALRDWYARRRSTTDR